MLSITNNSNNPNAFESFRQVLPIQKMGIDNLDSIRLKTSTQIHRLKLEKDMRPQQHNVLSSTTRGSTAINSVRRPVTYGEEIPAIPKLNLNFANNKENS